MYLFSVSEALLIFVQDIDNKVSVFQINGLKPESTVKELKEKIALLKGLPIWAFHVLFKNLLLKDLETLAACKIPEGGTVTVIIKKPLPPILVLLLK